MSIASAHGLVEYHLPSGEEHRLRFVNPLARGAAIALLGDPQSPYFVDGLQQADWLRLEVITGGVLRSLTFAVEHLRLGNDVDAVEKALLARHVDTMLVEFVKVGSKEEQQEALRRIPEILRGEVLFEPNTRPIKNLYDVGVLKRDSESQCMVPVSSITATALHTIYSMRMKGVVPPMSQMRSPAEQGYNLEIQLAAQLHLANTGIEVTAALVFGKARQTEVKFELKADAVFVFDQLDEIERHGSWDVLYLPKDLQFTCDGVLVPADVTKPVILWDSSVTEPRKADRKNKYATWAGITLESKTKAGVATEKAAQKDNAGTLFVAGLRRKFKQSTVQCVVFYPKKLASKGASQPASWDAAMASLSTSDAEQRCVWAVDRKGLERLGVRL
jgi:hypothetical protein